MSTEHFQNPEYQEQRNKWLGIIRKSAVLDAVKSNANMINYALVTTAVAAIVAGFIHVPVWGIVALVGGALAAAGVSFYAAYKNENMSKTTDMKFREAQHVANSRVNAKELAVALKEAFTEDPTKNHVAFVQKPAKWEERVQLSEQSASQSIN